MTGNLSRPVSLFQNWRHRVGSAAAEPAADDEDFVEGDAGAGKSDSAFEDAQQPKRRRYSRKRPRPGADGGGAAAAEEQDTAAPKRRKGSRPAEEDQAGDGDEYRRRKPIQRRRRPLKQDAAEPEADDDLEKERRLFGNPYEQPSSTTENAATPVDLKALLKQTAGQLSLSELLQNRNLSLSDLLKGNRGALSALTATPNTESPPQQQASTTTRTVTTTSDQDGEANTERHNGFVPSKPRRLPPVQRPTPSAAAPAAFTRPVSEEPEVTTSRPRRLPAVVARAKEAQQSQQQDALDPMSPAMMAMITLEAADSHTSKPRRIPSAPPTSTSTAAPEKTTSPSDSQEKDSQPKPPTPKTTTSAPASTPPREFYPLNVDSLEITTPRLMGVSKPKDSSGKPWQPPADRIIDAQVFSPGAITHKFRPHGFVLPTEQEVGVTMQAPEEPPPPPLSTAAPVAPAAPRSPTTLQNTSDHFRLENETLDLKEGNALDKRKIALPSPRPEHGNGTAASQANELDKDKEREKADKRKQFAGSAPRRLPPTLAGSRRLPAVNRPKITTEVPKEESAEQPERPQRPERPERTERPDRPDRPRVPPSIAKQNRNKETLLPPTRFALPLPEVISVEKMIADAKSRGALASTPGDGRTSTSERPSSAEPAPTTASTTTFRPHDEILDLLKSEQSSARLARILAERNMTLDDLLQHRERGSSQLHFADFFRNATTSNKEDTKPVDLVPKEITAPTERKESVNILRSFHEVPKYPFTYSGADDSEEAASTLSLVNVKPAGIVLPADPGERYHRGADPAPTPGPAAPSRAPRVIPPPQPYPIPTYRHTEDSQGGTPYLVIKHVADTQQHAPTMRALPDNVMLEHVGEIRQVGSSSVEDAIVVDSEPQHTSHNHHSRRQQDARQDGLVLPSGVKSAIIASTVICGLAIVGFLTIFIVFRWRQKRALIRARGAILCEQLQRGSFRGRSLSPVLVNVSKASQVQQIQPSGAVPYYSKKDLSSRATSNTASNRHYYLWRSLRKTFQEDDME